MNELKWFKIDDDNFKYEYYHLNYTKFSKVKKNNNFTIDELIYKLEKNKYGL